MKQITKEYKIKNESGDREFFTIIPNFILNHSTANDQSLYCQMKKMAGEDGECFATQETLMNLLGIGRRAFNKSLEYLLKKGWITYLGATQGKTRPIKTYKINNIWHQNSNYYKKISVKREVSFKRDTGQNNKDIGQNSSKIPAERTVEEEPIKQDINNKNNIGLLINYFFELKKWAYKDKSFYQKNKIIYARFTRPAKQLLELCDDNIDEAKNCVKKIAEWADSRGLDWSLETIFKKWYDIDYLKPKEKKPFIDGMRAFQKIEGGKWYIISRSGEIKEYGTTPKEIIYK